MKLQLKRSNVLELGAAKEPTAPQMEYGELAVNYNTGDPAIFLKDSNDNIIRIAGTGNINSGDNPSGDTLPPTGNDIGDMFFNTTNNTMYYWDGSEWVPIANDVTAADIFVGTLAEINAEVPEDDRRNGFLWWNVEDGTLYIWYIDANTSQFVIAIPSTGGGGGSGASVVVLDTPPTDPEQGDMWWNTIDGRLYIWYQDVDSGQWVDASPDSQVSPITSGPVFPADALENDCFFNTTDGRLYIYYDDGTSLQWVDASPDSQGAVYWNRVNGELVPTSDTDNVNIGDGNIVLNSDGSITAAGPVQSGGNPNLGANIGIRFNQNGNVQACAAADKFVFFGLTEGVPEPTILMRASGSAIFAGPVQSGGDGYLGAEDGIVLSPAGKVSASRDITSVLFEGFTTGNPVVTSRINANGSATFASGTSDAPGVFIGKNNSNGAYPSLYLQQDNPDGNFLTCKNGFSGALTSRIGADGSATFAGPVAIGGNDAANTIEEYEQGSWTPFWTGNGAAIGAGTYIRVGNVCTCFADIIFPGTNATETQILGGLPFQCRGNQAFGGYSELVSTNKYPGFTFVHASSQYFSVRSSGEQNVDLLRNDVAGIGTNFVLQYEIA